MADMIDGEVDVCESSFTTFPVTEMEGELKTKLKLDVHVYKNIATFILFYIYKLCQRYYI